MARRKFRRALLQCRVLRRRSGCSLRVRKIRGDEKATRRPGAGHHPGFARGRRSWARCSSWPWLSKTALADLIANFMIAANVAMAQFLEAKGGPTCGASCARRSTGPASWRLRPNIARNCRPQPDSRALAEFLLRQKESRPVHFPDLSLAVVKSLGPGEYAVQLPGEAGRRAFRLWPSRTTRIRRRPIVVLLIW